MSSSLRLKSNFPQQYQNVKLSVKKQTITAKKAMKKKITPIKKSIQFKKFTVLEKKDKVKQEVDLKCDMCEYTCKKRNILN